MKMDGSTGARSSSRTSCREISKSVVFVVLCIFLIGMSMTIGQTQGSRSNIRKALAVYSRHSVQNDEDANQKSTTEISSLVMVPDPPITTPPSESMYENLWPGRILPLWANKRVNYDVPRSQSMCYVHVGKAGGSAVGCSLGFSLHCGSKRKTTQIGGTLPKITTTVFHKDVYNCHEDDARYLFVVRDPIERARSAFNYDRPDKGPTKGRYIRYYVECSFRTIEGMVQEGLSNHGHASSRCKHIAHHAIRGNGWDAPSHFYYNYQYYWESIPENSRTSVIALRNEHLNEDWNALEERLSGVGNIMNEETMPTLNANAVTQDDLYISNESLEILCEALCNEIQVYKKILRLAENLNSDQVNDSLDALALKCPREAMSNTCPEKMPDIKRKLKDNRGYYPEDEETLE